MARALNIDEVEVFKDALSPERMFPLESGTLEGLMQRRDAELELTPESAFWFACHIPGASNS
jgi:hypothetical protein